MTQPIDRETAIALAKEAGKDTDFTKHIELWTPDTWQFTERLCNLAVSHSRKDAEPVAWRFLDDEEPGYIAYQGKPPTPEQVAYLAKWNRPAWEPLFTHPPEADKLIRQALEALDGALSDDKPYIAECKGSATAIRTYLEGKK